MIRPLDQSNSNELGVVLALVQHSQHVQHVDFGGRDTAEASMLLAAETWDHNLGDITAHYFVDDDNGVIKGYILVRSELDDTALIDDLGVGQAYLRQGIGTALVEHAIGWAQDNGFSAIKLMTTLDNIPAAKTYRKTGFTETAGDMLHYEKLLK